MKTDGRIATLKKYADKRKENLKERWKDAAFKEMRTQQNSIAGKVAAANRKRMKEENERLNKQLTELRSLLKRDVDII